MKKLTIKEKNLIKKELKNDIKNKNISTNSGDNYAYKVGAIGGTVIIHEECLEWMRDTEKENDLEQETITINFW